MTERSRWRKPCRARCAHSGRTCALLEGHLGAHAHGRIRFTEMAADGQAWFPRELELEAAAHCRPEEALDG